MKLWLHTEERPRVDVIEKIIDKFLNDNNFESKKDPKIRVIPVMEKNKFTFRYKVLGINSKHFTDILVTTVSGLSSFVDYMVFYSNKEPTNKDTPLYLIEETKTDDKESRNTGVYQRCSKFVYAKFFYPKTPLIMMYNLKVLQKETPTLTYVFGTRMLSTLEIEVMGKDLNMKMFEAFKDIDELIELKNAMPLPYNGVPVRITKLKDRIEISAKLEKAGGLSHDPNIGMTTIIASCLRKLGWDKKIVITKHRLTKQSSIGKTNKFVMIANQIGIELENLEIPKADLKIDYWKEERSKEKIGTIFTSILCEEFAEGISIYENHGGCERGYFISLETNEYLVIGKYSDRDKYKMGDKKSIIYIPDVVIYDEKRKEVINCEGKKYINRDTGYEEMMNFDFFEKEFISKFYKESKTERTLILFGGDKIEIEDDRIGLLLNQDGEIILGKKSPKIFKEAFEKLLSS